MSRTLSHLVFTAALCIAAASVQAEDTQQVFGSWTLRCSATNAQTPGNCMMFQNLVQKAGGQPVLQFGIGLAPPDGLPTVLVSLPLGIALPPGITVQIDSGSPAVFPIERCEPDGCRASFKMRDTTVQQLSQGKQLRLTFYDGERKPLKVSLSLDGFGAAFKALSGATH